MPAAIRSGGIYVFPKRGSGDPIYDLMENTATAEIRRAQVWQWVKHGRS